MRKQKDLVVIFRAIVNKDYSIEYKPVDVIEGIYDDENKRFFDKNRTPYLHIINTPDSYGFCFRRNILEYKKNYPKLPLFLIKRKILKAANKVRYKCGEINEDNDIIPTIISSENASDRKILLDTDIAIYYLENHPDFAVKFFNGDNIGITIDKESEEIPEKNNININEFYKEITTNVIGQDEPIRKILTAIWKQYSDFSDNKSRNILINGSTGVGKTEIFRILSKLLDIPCVITSATEYTAAGYKGDDISDMFIQLITRAGGDIKRAEKGILIIDEIDKLSESNSNYSQINQRDVQEALLKVLEDGIFKIEIDKKPYEFNTSKLMVIGMGSWSRIESKQTSAIGFCSASNNDTQVHPLTRDEIIKNGMIPELIGRFPVIVQMNELDSKSLIRILKEVKNSALSLNKDFLNRKGIELNVSDEVLEVIADKAVRQKFGARSLDEIVENALSVASFEIALNSELYSELIITPETIEDNRKYTLVRKK